MIKTENRKTSDDFEMDAFRMATIVENEKEKLLYIYEHISELINLINQQKAVSENYDTIKEKAMNLLKIGCDIPMVF